MCWRLDRLGRNLRHLILLLDELQALGIALRHPWRGHRHLHARRAVAAAHPVRDCGVRTVRIQERVVAGLARAKAQGQRLGRPERDIPVEQIAAVRGLPVREAARRLGIPRTTLQRALARIPAESTL